MEELFDQFQEFRKILCICPCCGDLVRVSDLKLKAKRYKSCSWLDDYDKMVRGCEQNEEKFSQEEEKLRETSREKGREAAELIFSNSISPSLKKLKLNPYDVKPLFFPIDFIVFDGMNRKEEIDKLILLSKMTNSPVLGDLRKKVKVAVENDKYNWEIARIDEEGNVKFV